MLQKTGFVSGERCAYIRCVASFVHSAQRDVQILPTSQNMNLLPILGSSGGACRTLRAASYRALVAAFLIAAAAQSGAATLNVTSYGAIPNDSGDDTAGIQAAITASVAGDEVFLPAGIYRISNSLAPKSNTKFYGAGLGSTTILYVGTVAHSLINITSVTGMEAAYLTIDGGGASAAAIDGIKATTCSGLYVHDFKVQNIGTANTGDGVQFTGSVTNSLFQNCSFSNIGVGNDSCSAYRISQSSSGNTVTGNTIDNTGRGGILCDTNSTDLVITHNTITRSGADGGTGLGIELFGGCDRAVVEDNSVDHWISISGSSFAAVRRNNVTATDGTVGFTAVECVTSHDSIFTDNVSTGGQGDGVSISGGPEQYDFFAYNNFSNSATWGIQVQYPSVRNLYFYKDTYASTVNSSGVPYSAGFGFRINGGDVQFVTLDGLTITNNPSWGIQALGVTQNPPVDSISIVNCTITNNASAYSWGGSIANLEWANNTVSGNGNNAVPTSSGFTDQKPVAVINGPSIATTGQLVTFTSGSTDPDGTIAHTLWDVNAGPPLAATSASYTYETPGTYRISLLVWDNVGRGAHAEKTLTVIPVKFETENLAVAAQTSGVTERVATDARFSNDAGTFFDATAVSQFVSYDVPNVGAGTYDVRIGVKDWNNKGIWQLNIARLDGTGGSSNVGSPYDEYTAGEVFTEIDMGHWTAGSTSDKAFKFTVTGKNSSSAGYGLAFDYIKLVPQ